MRIFTVVQNKISTFLELYRTGYSQSYPYTEQDMRIFTVVQNRISTFLGLYRTEYSHFYRYAGTRKSHAVEWSLWYWNIRAL
jgi:hypothetical protein